MIEQETDATIADGKRWRYSVDKRGLWQAVLGELEVSISRANFATWFKNTAILSNEDGHVVVAVPNIFTKEWLEKKYHADIKTALSKMGSVDSVEYTISSTKVAEDGGSRKQEAEAKTQNLSIPAQDSKLQAQNSASSLNPKYTFDNFVVGSSNELAYAACQAVAKNPGNKYNPLFLYGGVGLGKTHLMQAVGNEIIKNDSSKRVEYVSSEGFTSLFISSVSSKKTAAFAQRFRNIDVLIVDDVQFFAGKEKTQEEFFHTFNALHQANKQIILSSDKPPRAIPTLEDRLRSRFESGMTADIQAPDLETRSAIIQSKAASQGIMLSREVIEYIASNIKNNIRELEGALTQLIAHCEFKGIEPSIAVATGILGNIAASKPRLKPLSPKLIIEKVASYYDLRPEDITGPKRDKEIVVPRQVAMYLMRGEMSLSFPKIALSCGGRDHTTAMHSVNKIEKQLEANETLRAEIAAIRERIFI
jgi:chromosomal replication initiator protein